MPPPSSSPLLPFTILLFSLLTPSLPSPAPNCSSSTCGDPPVWISYPFWLTQDPDQPPSSYCGYPDLMLYCINNLTTVLYPPGGGEYTVTTIDPSSQTLSLVDAAAVSGINSSSCPLPRHNITVGGSDSSLNITSKDSDLLFFYNCSKSTVVGQSSCGGGGGGRYSYVFTSDAVVVPGDCEETVVAPVLHSAVVGDGGFFSGDVAGVVKQGFQLRWSTPDLACQRCESTGGRCGYDDGLGCICDGEINGQDCGSRNSTENGGRRRGLVIGVGTAGGFSLAMVLSLGFVLYRRRRRTKKRSTLLDGTGSLHPSSKSDPELGCFSRAPIFSYDELYQATNGFHASNVLGDGGFGTVYKGKVRDGREVAVKRLYENNSRRVEQFTNEVSILSLLRHPNLVSLYGCTPRRSPALLLVYEFVPNGTVAEHLHGPQAPTSPLPWGARMSIAVQTADALSYLHSVEPPIIHRDVKTSNILLDGDLHVKVADFGLSRLFPLDATHVSTAPQGTPGYLDPEYHQCYQLTEKSDVYSFGVVLMELISSKPAVDLTRQRNEINLAVMAIGKMQRRELHELVDPKLGFLSDSAVERMVKQVAEVAFRCLQADRDMRPRIKDVLDDLRRIEKDGDDALVSSPLLSPDSVTVKWGSIATTPNSSG